MAKAGVRQPASAPRSAVRGPAGLRALGWFWAAIGLAAAAGAATLQVLGPPPAVGGHTPPDSHNTAHAPDPAGHADPGHVASATPVAHEAAAGHATSAEHAPAAGHDAAPAPAHAAATEQSHDAAHPPTVAEGPAPGAPIRAPDPALLEPAAAGLPARLPRIGADGRLPRRVYAAGYDATDRRPRVAILLGGTGQSEADTDDASRSLPAAVSFVVSPYTMRPDRVLDGIRARGHEMLVGLPMEPMNYPVNDEGSSSLLTFAPSDQNEQRLDWVLSRIEGYVGVTNALDGLRGERFSAATIPMGAVLRQVAARGLLYVDAVPALSRLPRDLPPVTMRGVDMILDEPAVRSEIDAKLAAVEQLARDRGAALGLAGLPRPVTLSRIAAWSAGLDGRGIALVPVSQLVSAPVKRADSAAGPAEAPH